MIDEFCHIESFSAKLTAPSAEIRQKLRNCVKNGNILADCSAQLELLPFSFVDVAEEMPPGLGLQDEVQNIQRPQVIVQDAVWWPVCDQNVSIVRYVFIGTDDNIRILRHLQAAMVAMGVGECDDDFIIKRYHKTGSL
ncbi:MAG: hypothetical protein SOY28_04735 [Roseburia sp.]|nr:hypothetical protein [Roseburia sp.]